MQRIFIGDVQGCADELDEMLARAAARFGEQFELWSVGDLVNRGPHSLRALRRVRALVERGRARLVLGNHELALLRTALGLRPRSASDSFDDVLQAPDAGDWIEWLRRRPLAETGRLGEQPFAMVHAALHPDWSLEELCARARAAEAELGGGDLTRTRRFLISAPAASPERDALGRLTSCRSVTRAGGWSEEPPDGRRVAWHRAWAERGHAYGVVYGHWALQGLHVAPGLRGLDTGCVHHGRGHVGALTAWLPDPGSPRAFDLPDERFWRVPAKRAYFAQRNGAA